LKKHNLLNGIVSILTLLVLLIDYFFIHEFNIESVFLLIAFTLIIVNLIRQLNQNVWRNAPLGITTDILIGLFSIAWFYVLSITLFGYGFSGKQVQVIWALMMICNSSFFILTIIDIGKLKSSKNYIRKSEVNGMA
jgi:hypothetical protein